MDREFRIEHRIVLGRRWNAHERVSLSFPGAGSRIRVGQRHQVDGFGRQLLDLGLLEVFDLNLSKVNCTLPAAVRHQRDAVLAKRPGVVMLSRGFAVDLYRHPAAL